MRIFNFSFFLPLKNLEPYYTKNYIPHTYLIVFFWRVQTFAVIPTFVYQVRK